MDREQFFLTRRELAWDVDHAEISNFWGFEIRPSKQISSNEGVALEKSGNVIRIQSSAPHGKMADIPLEILVPVEHTKPSTVLFPSEVEIFARTEGLIFANTASGAHGTTVDVQSEDAILIGPDQAHVMPQAVIQMTGIAPDKQREEQ